MLELPEFRKVAAAKNKAWYAIHDLRMQKVIKDIVACVLEKVREIDFAQLAEDTELTGEIMSMRYLMKFENIARVRVDPSWTVYPMDRIVKQVNYNKELLGQYIQLVVTREHASLIDDEDFLVVDAYIK
jgi:hypothetical protein